MTNSVTRRPVSVQWLVKHVLLRDSKGAVIFKQKSMYSRAWAEAVVLRCYCAETIQQMSFKPLRKYNPLVHAMIHVCSLFILADLVRLLLFHSHSLSCFLGMSLRNQSLLTAMTDKAKKYCCHYMLLIFSTWKVLMNRKWGNVDHCVGSLHTTVIHTELLAD